MSRAADRPVPRALACALVLTAAAAPARAAPAAFTIPDVPLVTQDGAQVRFYSDLIANKVVAINFIFTTCTTVCPPLGLKFERLQQLLGERLGKEVFLVSVSVDPLRDTPQRLNKWAARFHARPGWTLVTGERPEIDRLLRAFQSYAALPEGHTPMVLIGNDATRTWTRAYGLGSAAALAKAIAAVETPRKSAERYFTDTRLIDQDGKALRFYSDLVRGRSVVISTFFTTCTGICPLLNSRMQAIQERLGRRLGKDVVLISISVDPERDTPRKVREYARRYRPRPGWHFLTGPSHDVRLVLRKLGHLVEDPEDHTGVLLVGNDRTELWKKARGFAPAGELIAVVESVVGAP